MTEAVLVPVKRADIPEALMKWVKQDAQAGKIQGTWTEVVGWDSCKLMARKQGAVTRYAVSHYGYYQCCRKAKLQVEGHPLKGTSYRELPMWALTRWITAKAKAKESIAEGYRLKRTQVRLTRWERISVDQFVIYFVELETLTTWRVTFSRKHELARFRSDDMLPARKWEPSIHGYRLAPAA